MTATVSIEIPCDIVHASRMTTDELKRELRSPCSSKVGFPSERRGKLQACQ